MCSRGRFLVVAFFVLTLGSFLRLSAAADVPTVLVIPAKPYIVAFCTDVAMMKPLDIVSYEVSRKTNAPPMILNLWNGQTRDWTRVVTEDYRSGSLFKEMPKRVILLGNNLAAVAELKGASAVMGDIIVVPNLDAMGMANSLNDILKFSPSEWRFLANRYGLQLKDLNSERRRYGKYGPPGAKPSAPMPKSEDEKPVVKGPAPMDLPPVESVTSAKAAPTPPENK